MKLVFVSNYLNYHQSLFWDSFVEQSDIEFVFLSTEVFDNNPIKKPVLRNYEQCSLHLSDIDLLELLKSCDYLVIGACGDKRILRFVHKLKCTIFHNSEHYWKKTNDPISFARRVIRMIELKYRYRNKKIYVLANSSRLYKEFKFWNIGNCKKTYVFKFGYYPPVNDKPLIQFTKRNGMVYIGRIIRWKRVGMSLNAFDYITSNYNPNIKISIYGEGDKKFELLKRIKKTNNRKNIFVGDFISHSEVLNKFSNSEIFVFSSNKEEGWGAVLNEALSCGTIVFASSQAGATNFLIKDGYNGYTFNTKKELFKKIDLFYSLPTSERATMSDNAFNTISNLWNCKIASNRFIHILNNLSSGKNIDCFKDGPLSIQSE